ncbi:MAG: hypothetical protein IT285_08305 [Bdellovibrionales bacterium]|nr:hypothetical protein [Bdellovibrionales bacterium]
MTLPVQTTRCRTTPVGRGANGSSAAESFAPWLRAALERVGTGAGAEWDSVYDLLRSLPALFPGKNRELLFPAELRAAIAREVLGSTCRLEVRDLERLQHGGCSFSWAQKRRLLGRVELEPGSLSYLGRLGFPISPALRARSERVMEAQMRSAFADAFGAPATLGVALSEAIVVRERWGRGGDPRRLDPITSDLLRSAFRQESIYAGVLGFGGQLYELDPALKAELLALAWLAPHVVPSLRAQGFEISAEREAGAGAEALRACELQMVEHIRKGYVAHTLERAASVIEGLGIASTERKINPQTRCRA